jgi:hypothetical protein
LFFVALHCIVLLLSVVLIKLWRSNNDTIKLYQHMHIQCIARRHRTGRALVPSKDMHVQLHLG